MTFANWKKSSISSCVFKKKNVFQFIGFISTGKFKTGMKDYKADFKPLTPQELQELLQSKDHQMEVKGQDESSCLGEKELEILLDRSDLVEKWASKTENKKGIHKIVLQLFLVSPFLSKIIIFELKGSHLKTILSSFCFQSTIIREPLKCNGESELYQGKYPSKLSSSSLLSSF